MEHSQCVGSVWISGISKTTLGSKFQSFGVLTCDEENPMFKYVGQAHMKSGQVKYPTCMFPEAIKLKGNKAKMLTSIHQLRSHAQEAINENKGPLQD